MSEADLRARLIAARYPPGLVDGLAGRHLPALDGVRGIAALGVVLYHFDETRFLLGGYGVLAFFVLSGFLITWLLCRERERAGTISLVRFYTRRSLRIFPAFYVCWFITTAALLAAGKSVPWGQALSSFFYVGNYYQGLHGYPSSGYSHMWSLGVEEQFYLVWPVLFILIGGLSGGRRALTVALVVVLMWGVRIVLQLWGVPDAYIYTAFETRVDQLLVGCLLAVVLRAGLAGGFIRGLTCSPIQPFVTVAALVAFLRLSLVLGPGFRNTVGFCVVPVLVAILLLQLIAAPRSWLVRWLDLRPVAALGLISYSVYLYQQLVLRVMKRHLLAGLPTAGNLLLVVAAVIAAASVSYVVVEKPCNALKERWAERLATWPSRSRGSRE